MIEAASNLVLIFLMMNPIGDRLAGDEDEGASGYELCVPWAFRASPRSWDEVVEYYTEPSFALPGEIIVLRPLPGPAGVPARGELSQSPPKNPLLAEWDQVSREPRKVVQKSEGNWGSLSSQMVVQEAGTAAVVENPTLKRQWQVDEAWKCPVLGPFSLYGQVNAVTAEVQQRDMTVMGKTGLACSVPVVIPQAALTLRSGPSWTYTDPLRPELMREKTEWVMEVEGRLALVAGIGLEYQGMALPALTPLDHDKVSQDLRLAFPMGTNGKFKLGAKRQWETTPDSRIVNDNGQLYLGLELTR
jgi:hypothetical protein